MTRSELLPGTRRDDTRLIHCDSRDVVGRARRMAAVRDCAQLLLVVAVDLLCIRFPQTHVPFATRSGSVELVVIFNLLAFGHFALSRAWPRWQARRIASSWSLSERRRIRF